MTKQQTHSAEAFLSTERKTFVEKDLTPFTDANGVVITKGVEAILNVTAETKDGELQLFEQEHRLGIKVKAEDNRSGFLNIYPDCPPDTKAKYLAALEAGNAVPIIVTVRSKARVVRHSDFSS